MIKKNKQQKEPANPDAVADRTAKLTNESGTAVKENMQGILYGNGSDQAARFMDMLEGDEVENAAFIDIGKVQMFLFTCIALLLYGHTLWVLFGKKPEDITKFPGLTEAMVTIIGFSHAAYLGMKTVDQTKTDPNAVPPQAPPAQSDHEDNGELDA